MNIDTIISNLHPILLDIVNPTNIDIVNKLIVSIDSIVYKKKCEPIDIYENCILYEYTKCYDDIITNIKCNFKFSIILQPTKNAANLDSIKNLELVYPNYKYNPKEIYENSFIITLPVLFMVNTDIRFKIYADKTDGPNIKLTYDSYTLNNAKLHELNNIYLQKKYITNNRGMIFEEGFLQQDFDLD